MPMQKVAVVTCPNCQTRFQTPILQVLDVRVNPNLKGLLLQGALNIAACPQCGYVAPLNLPFIYHDPEKEKALLYLPMDVGANEVERQKIAGQLTRELMDSIPQEERKGYLFQPETFFNLETLIERVLELDGITKEMLERRKAQQEWLMKLLEQEPETWEAELAEHPDWVDEDFFILISVMYDQLRGYNPDHPAVERARQLFDYLTEHTEIGQTVQRRNAALRKLQENPTRAGLIEALQLAPDEQTVMALVGTGMPVMDYQFFKDLLKLIEDETDPERKRRLTLMREQVLAAREDIRRQQDELIEARLKLLEDIINAQDRKKMILSHRSEIDEVFGMVLESQLDGAMKQGYEALYKELQDVVRLISEIAAENLPPELRLVQKLLEAPDDAALEQMLDRNARRLTPEFVAFLQEMVDYYEQSEAADLASRLRDILARVQARVGGAAPASATEAPAAPQPPVAPSGGEQTTTPSGLIIAKR